MSDFQHAFSRQYPLYLVLHLVGNKAKGRISKPVFQENKAHQTFRKVNISYPLICTRTFVYQGVRNVRFSENLACFVFLKRPFWDSPFCLITDELGNITFHKSLWLLWDFFNRFAVAFFEASVLKEVRILCVISTIAVGC